MTTEWFAPARAIAAILLAAVVVLGSACVTSNTDEVEGAREPLATSTTVTDEQGTLEVGVATATRRGNTVAVLDTEASDGRFHALVEACAGASAPDDVGVSLSFFALQLRDGSGLSPIEPGDAREPALRTLTIEPATCTVGWLTFRADEHLDEVQYLVFRSRTTSTRWELEPS